MRLETAPVAGTGSDETALATSMNDNVSLFADASFPVYTLSTDQAHTSACQGRRRQLAVPIRTSLRLYQQQGLL